MLYAATTDDDAHVRECLGLVSCECIEFGSGHDIHVERPDVFVEAVGRAV